MSIDNNITINKTEPIWTYQAKLQKLDEKLIDTEKSLEEKIKKSQSLSLNTISLIKSDVVKDISQHLKTFESHLDEFKYLKSSIEKDISDLKLSVENDFKLSEFNLQESANNFKTSIRNELNILTNTFNQSFKDYDKEHNAKIIQVFNSLAATNKKLDRIQFDIIDNENNLSVTYVNPLGKTEYVAFRKALPDGETLKYTKDKKIGLKYSFDPIDLPITNDVINVKSITLSSGNHLTGDKIINDLSTNTQSIKNITTRLDQLVNKISKSNGYIASNDFRSSTPTQEDLTQFAISCISTSPDDNLTKYHIPSGTKIKNLYDNHVWILNNVFSNGLTIIKWEDFGSDDICIATNQGVHGLVAGSYDKYRGCVDLQGVLSINGLEEELNSINLSLKEIVNNLNSYREETNIQLESIKNRIKALEDKA